jgi:hypothetical protein
MPEFIRSIVNRLREFVGNRRRAPRYQTHLEVELALSVSLPVAKASAQGPEQLRLAGYTRDVSESGLALIVSAIRIGGQYITDSNRTLQLTLKLPTGLIKIHGTTVRYTPLDEDATDTGYLIGVHIERMTDDDRARFTAYLERMKDEG